MQPIIRKCSSEDLAELRDFSCQTYYDTFKHMNTESNMKAYLEEAFNTDKMREELSNKDSDFYFLYLNEKLSGYLKLNECNAQTAVQNPSSLELERIYVIKELQGKGLGSILMNKAINEANIRNKSFIWLGVWEKNKKALQFYKMNGFYEMGKHSFYMGVEEQTDYIMRKDLL